MPFIAPKARRPSWRSGTHSVWPRWARWARSWAGSCYAGDPAVACNRMAIANELALGMRRHPLLRKVLAVSAIALMCGLSSACADAVNKPIPAAAVDKPKAGAPATETAVLAGGCFWGMQGVFELVNGVKRVVAGY